MKEINQLECTRCYAELSLENAVDVVGGQQVECEYCNAQFLYSEDTSGDYVRCDKFKGDKIVVGQMNNNVGVVIGRNQRVTVDGDFIGGYKISGDKVGGTKIVFNQSEQCVKGVQINTVGDINLDSIGGNYDSDGDWVGGDKFVGDKVVINRG